MIIVLKASNTDVILLDSVPAFNEAYSANVTSHPVESGSKITDHVIIDNTKIKMSGVVSDYNFVNPVKAVVNSVEGYENTLLNSNEKLRILPNGVPTSTSYTISQSTTSLAVRDRLKRVYNDKELVEIFMYADNGNKIDSFPNCILTNLDFKQDTETGDGCIYPEMSFEQIKVVVVKVTQGSASKIPQLQGQGSEGNDLGNVAQDVSAAVKKLDLPTASSAPQMAVDAIHNQTVEVSDELRRRKQLFDAQNNALGRAERTIGIGN